VLQETALQHVVLSLFLISIMIEKLILLPQKQIERKIAYNNVVPIIRVGDYVKLSSISGSEHVMFHMTSTRDVERIANSIFQVIHFDKISKETVIVDSLNRSFVISSNRIQKISLQDYENTRKRYMLKKMFPANRNDCKRYLTTILSSIYPKENFDVSNIKIGSSNMIFADVTIHYPHIEITNTTGATHDIYDLYVRFTFNFDSINSLISLNDTRLARTTFAPKENIGGTNFYIFSHAHVREAPWRMEAENFCYGNGTPINELVRKTRCGVALTDLSKLFVAFNEYLKWESLEGGPFYMFNSLKNSDYREYQPQFLPHYNDMIELIFTELLKQAEDFRFSFSSEDTSISSCIAIKVRDLDEVIQNVAIGLITTNPLVDDLFCYYYNPGIYTRFDKFDSDKEDYLKNLKGIESNFSFKGNPVPLRIIENTDATEENLKQTLPRILHHKAITEIKKRLESTFLTYLLFNRKININDTE
jgi:hypothetical protein